MIVCISLYKFHQRILIVWPTLYTSVGYPNIGQWVVEHKAQLSICLVLEILLRKLSHN